MNLKAIISEAKAGSYRAQNEIIKHFEPLIRSTLHKKRYYSNIMTDEDFEQLHRIGIWMAIDTFPKHFYKISKDKSGNIKFREFDGTNRFVGWMKMCMQHHVTRELRKEHQKCRTAEIVSLDEETDFSDGKSPGNVVLLIDRIPATRSVYEASIGFFDRLAHSLTKKEAACFQMIANGYTFNDVAIELRKQHPNLRKDDVKLIRDKMLQKVKQEVSQHV